MPQIEKKKSHHNPNKKHKLVVTSVKNKVLRFLNVTQKKNSKKYSSGNFEQKKKAHRKQSTMPYNVVTFNCCLSTWVNGAFARSARMADGFYSSIPYCDVDVICLQELVVDFNGVASRFMHHKHHTKQVTSGWYTDNFRPWPSGLCILSRWPIKEQDSYIFKGPSYHWEKFMAKAILYAKIEVSKRHFIHVFTTHLQAWTNETASKNRAHQMVEIGAFMQQKLEGVDLATELVVLGLDANMDLFEHATHVKHVFELANLKIIRPSSPMFSFDPSRNPLVATDDPREYELRANVTSNDICENQIKESQQANFPKQLIDFFAISKDQKTVVEIVKNDVIPIQTISPYPVLMNLNNQVAIRTLSDHFAVYASFVMKPSDNSQQVCQSFSRLNQKCNVPKTKVRKNSNVHVGWVITTVCFFLVCFFILFWLFQCLWGP